MKRIAFVVLIFIGLLLACQQEENHSHGCLPPQTCDDGLETASLEDVGMATGPIRVMMDYINDTEMHRIHDILILRNHKLVFEEYFPGYAFVWNSPGIDGAWMEYDRETDHFMASVSKSVTSVVVGCAVKEGLLTDLNRTVLSFCPEYADVLTGQKANITLVHLLTMTSGLHFDETSYPYSDPRNDITAMFAAADPISFVLEKPLTSTPGAEFFYNSGTTNVLAAIVAKVAGKGFLDVVNERLFNPLHTRGGEWHSFPSGDTFASGGLFLKPRELAKIGLMFLNDGLWQGEQIVTPDWISWSQQQRVATVGFPADFGYGYGFLWWIRDFVSNETNYRCYFAAGWGDQYMFIIPSLDMIIVFNCGNYQTSARISPFDLVEEYILEAVN
jgi:CubicO group peptidase (beta-lactamase class C family)